MNIFLTMVVAVVSICSASIAVAAPFCVVFSSGKQCYYYDLRSCQQAAGNTGACVTNSDETRAPSGGGQFCVVTGISTDCFYYDAQSCRAAARTSGGVCQVKTN